MDKSLLDYEVSIDADCKLLTVGKPFAIEGECVVGFWASPAVCAHRLVEPPPTRLNLSRLRHRVAPELTAHFQPVGVHQSLQVFRFH